MRNVLSWLLGRPLLPYRHWPHTKKMIEPKGKEADAILANVRTKLGLNDDKQVEPLDTHD
jgi:hypothetical protein